MVGHFRNEYYLSIFACHTLQSDWKRIRSIQHKKENAIERRMVSSVPFTQL